MLSLLRRLSWCILKLRGARLSISAVGGCMGMTSRMPSRLGAPAFGKTKRAVSSYTTDGIETFGIGTSVTRPNFRSWFLTVLCNPPKGLYIIVDTKELSFELAMKTLRPSVLSVIFNYFQRAAPVKLRTIHIFNSAYWAPKLLQMVSPFIDSKIVEQIVFYPRNLSLEELRERLPSDLGGELPSVDVLQERLIEKMESISAYYEAEELQR